VAETDSPAVTRFDWKLKLLLPINTARPMHFGAKARLRKDLAWWFRGQHKPPPEPWEKARIHITRFSSSKPDYGNLVESAKPLIDVLQPNSKRHPQGLGFIVDDSPDHLEEGHFWSRAKPGKGWTEVILMDLSPE
jgi:hypothetical protein